jgi:hypothetical protein
MLEVALTLVDSDSRAQFESPARTRARQRAETERRSLRIARSLGRRQPGSPRAAEIAGRPHLGASRS